MLSMLSLAGLQTTPATQQTTAVPATRPRAQPLRWQELEAQLQLVLEMPGWGVLPEQIAAVVQLGPAATAEEPPARAWFLTQRLSGNSRPSASEEQERQFRASIEAAHAGKSRVIIGGEIVLVDAAGRLWTIAEHTPHLLRCFDGHRWSYRRADGLPSADDEIAEFFRLSKERKLPRLKYDSDGLRDLNDMGRWFAAACADARGNLHFVGGTVSKEAEERAAAGYGIHTLRPDGSWIFSPLFEAAASPNTTNNFFHELQFTSHSSVPGAPDDFSHPLVTMVSAWGRVDDASARRHGFEPYGDGPEDEFGRVGAVYFAQFDGERWRMRRIIVSNGPPCLAIWPQRDGRLYVATRKGLRVADLPGEDGFASGPAELRFDDAAAPPLILGRWRFHGAYPQATMPDGRFAFNCERAVNDVAKFPGSIVIFNPADEKFVVSRLAEWNLRAAGAPESWARKPPSLGLNASVIDAERALWLPGGFRMKRGGYVERIVPIGLALQSPELVDEAGRVYFPSDIGTKTYIYRPELPATRPSQGPERLASPQPDPRALPAPLQTVSPAPKERAFDNVGTVYSNPDLRPPWNAWAITTSGGVPALMRLDGAVPTRLLPPAEIGRLNGVIPLDGGCIVTGSDGAGFWTAAGWAVAPSLRGLIEQSGQRLAQMVPRHAVANVWKGPLLASDGNGGLWVAELALPAPPKPGEHRQPGDTEPRVDAWHWDGQRFTDVWPVVGSIPRYPQDGPLFTVDGGAGLFVQIGSNPSGNMPGGWWIVRSVPMREGQDPHDPGRQRLYATLLAALGPNNHFARSIWVDRDGWMWSPMFSDEVDVWVRRSGDKSGYTDLRRDMPSMFAQAKDGPVWFIDRRAPAVYADVTFAGPEPQRIQRMEWSTKKIEGMGPAPVLAAAPDGRMWLLHEGGLSLLGLRQPPREDFPGLRPDAAPPRPQIVELTRQPWPELRNRFDDVAFDATGLWFRAANGSLIRVPLPAADPPPARVGAP